MRVSSEHVELCFYSVVHFLLAQTHEHACLLAVCSMHVNQSVLGVSDVSVPMQNCVVKLSGGLLAFC